MFHSSARRRLLSSWLIFAAAVGGSLLAPSACGGGSDDNTGSGGSGSGGSGNQSTNAAGTTSTGSGSCDTDPLKTGLPALFNGNSVDMDDCPVLEFTAKYNEPDAMIFKAIIYVESRFDPNAIGCTGNGPCCPAVGWTAAECACLGAMQTGPQCGAMSTLGLLPNGHPDLEMSSSAQDFANSVFNPVVNVELGISGIAGNRAQVKKQFPGCTEDQYTMMAVGNFNSYGSTKSCTVYNTDYDNAVLDAYKTYAAASGWPAHPY